MSKYRDNLPSGALHNMMEYIEDSAWEDAVGDLLMGNIGPKFDGADGFGDWNEETNVLAGDKVTMDDLEEVYDYYCYNNTCRLEWSEIVKNARDRIN